MRRGLISLLVLGCASWCCAQSQSMPQTARQALLEMFFGKTPGSFEKHLPNATKAAIREASHGSEPTMLQAFSMMSGQLSASGQHFETFDAGPTLLVVENSATQSKFEINVDSDDLRGDEDSIELSFKAYKNGEEQAPGVMPRLTFLMKQEGAAPQPVVWTLNEITFALRIPLDDPRFLKSIMEGMKHSQPATVSANTFTPGNSAGAVNSMRSIMSAEVTYARTYANHGYTCLLSDLDGFGADQPGEHQAMLIESRLASGKKFGYTFTLSGCSGAPAQRYQLTAVPSAPGSGRAFCSDQSGLIRYSDDGNAASCLAAGRPLE